jgi:hypothetical protein
MKVGHFSLFSFLILIYILVLVGSFRSCRRYISNIYTYVRDIQPYDRNTAQFAELNDMSPGDMSIEQLVALAEFEKQEQERLIREQLKSKMPSKKKRDNKEYEAYWQKKEREPKDGSKAAKLKEKGMLKAYYSLKENADWKETFPTIEQIKSDQEQTSLSTPKIPIPVVYGACKHILRLIYVVNHQIFELLSLKS